jgi:hypothetical protein
VLDDFVVMRHTRSGSILQGNDGAGYNVSGLSEPIAMLFPVPTPAIACTLLLPFCGRIIFDGLFLVRPEPMSRDELDSATGRYAEAAAAGRIVASLDAKG